MSSKIVALKNSTIFAVYLLIVWGFYRNILKFPDEVEEIFIKPVIWLVPVFFLVKKENKNLASVGVTLRNFFPSVYLALGFGVFFAVEGLLINYLKNNGLVFGANIGSSSFWAAFGLSFITATSEEIAFRGYLFSRIWMALKNEFWANILTSIFWALIHVPAAIFVWKLNFEAAITYLCLATLFGIGAAFIYARTKNIFSPVLLHVFWQWPIILFR